MNARLNRGLVDFLRRRQDEDSPADLSDFFSRSGEYADDVDVWPTPANPAKPPTLADVNAGRTHFVGDDCPGGHGCEACDGTSKLLARVEAAKQAEEEPVNPARSGVKYDQGKAMLSLLGMVTRALADVSRVQEYGAKKYPSPDNWKKVENGSRRYRDAALRHLFADLRGEAFDPETGLPHLTHAACCLLIAREHDLGFTPAEDGFELRPLAPTPEGEPLPSWRFERPPRR